MHLVDIREPLHPGDQEERLVPAGPREGFTVQPHANHNKRTLHIDVFCFSVKSNRAVSDSFANVVRYRKSAPTRVERVPRRFVDMRGKQKSYKLLTRGRGSQGIIPQL